MQSQIPHPREGLSDQIPDSPGKVNIQMPGVCPGGGVLMFRIDRRINSPWAPNGMLYRQ